MVSARKTPPRPAKLDGRLGAAAATTIRRLRNFESEPARDLYENLIESIWKELRRIDRDENWFELLSDARRDVFLVDELYREVMNGGFDQYFFNSSGAGAVASVLACQRVGLPKVAKLVEKANAQFKGGPSADRDRRGAQMEAMGERASDAWSRLDDKLFAMEIPDGGVEGACLRYIRAHEAEFFKVK